MDPTARKKKKKTARSDGFLLLSETAGWLAVLAFLRSAYANNMAMDRARDAVLHLDVHLGQFVLWESNVNIVPKPKDHKKV
jgi:hypothetical protein